MPCPILFATTLLIRPLPRKQCHSHRIVCVFLTTPTRRAFPKLESVEIATPIKQIVYGKGGVYRCILMEQRGVTAEREDLFEWGRRPGRGTSGAALEHLTATFQHDMSVLLSVFSGLPPVVLRCFLLIPACWSFPNDSIAFPAALSPIPPGFKEMSESDGHRAPESKRGKDVEDALLERSFWSR